MILRSSPSISLLLCATCRPQLQLHSLRHSSYLKEVIYDNFAIYSSHTYLATLFASSFDYLTVSSHLLAPASAIVVLNLGLRLATAPFFIHCERLTSRRIMTVNMIRKQVYEKVGAHYGVKPLFDEEIGKWTLLTNDNLILRNADELARKNIYEYLEANRMSMGTLIALRGCTMPVWMYAAMGMVNYMEGLYGARIPGFLWMDSLAQADPYMVLPLCAGTLAVLSIWANRWMFMSTEQYYRITARIFDCMLLLVALFGTKILMEAPALSASHFQLMSLHWCCAISTALAQNLLLRHPKVKRLFGIGPMPSDTRTPIRDLFRTRKRQPVSMF